MLGELGWRKYTEIREGKQKWLPDAVMLGGIRVVAVYKNT